MHVQLAGSNLAMESAAPIGMTDVNEPAPIVVKDVIKNALKDKPKAVIKKDDLRCTFLVTNGRCRNIVSRSSVLKLCEKHEQLYEFHDVD